jgi:hypothetical protein
MRELVAPPMENHMKNIFTDTIATSISIHHVDTMEVKTERVEDYYRTTILLKGKDGNDSTITIYSENEIYGYTREQEEQLFEEEWFKTQDEDDKFQELNQ